MRVDHETNRIFVRQSWLKDMLLCPERARFAVTKPEFKSTNDSAAIGTAVHAGIESVLSSGQTDNLIEVAVGKLNELKAEGIRTTNLDPSSWETHVRGLAKAWLTDIYPHVDVNNGQTELYFEVNTFKTVNGFELYFEGTMDYAQSAGLWDWKTSARKYSQLEKQSQDIQSSIYAYAGSQLQIVPPESFFNFGVMVRTQNPYGQIVTIHRTPAHAQFVIQQAISAVQSALAMQDSEHWLINDQHFLCSERWCPWWSLCKGAHISSAGE